MCKAHTGLFGDLFGSYQILANMPITGLVFRRFKFSSMNSHLLGGVFWPHRMQQYNCNRNERMAVHLSIEYDGASVPGEHAHMLTSPVSYTHLTLPTIL